MIESEEGEIPLNLFNQFLDADTEVQLEVLLKKLRTERTTVLKAMIKCALTQPDSSRVMVAAKERYEKCTASIAFVEFLQQKLPGWESLLKSE